MIHQTLPEMFAYNICTSETILFCICQLFKQKTMLITDISSKFCIDSRDVKETFQPGLKPSLVLQMRKYYPKSEVLKSR